MESRKENGKLKIELGERIDSVNALSVEQEIFDLISANSANNVELDAKELTYISSAGLRVLLKLHKQLEDSLMIVNVSRDICEIFETTGFSEFLNFKKALRELSVEGCEKVGEGVTSVVYRINPDTIVKVFRQGIRFEMISDEIQKSKNAFLAGIPTAIAYDLVKVGDSYGTVYEMLNAKELITVLIEDKAHIADHIRQFANVLREMHKIEVDPVKFPSVMAASLGALSYLEGTVTTPEETEKLRKIFESIPDRNTFIHGDCHPGNVMVQDGEMLFIDLSNGGSGHPIVDLMSMYLTYRVNPYNPEKRNGSIMLKHFTDEEINEIWSMFIKTYLDTEDEDRIALAEKQIEGFASARILLGAAFIPGLLDEQAMAFFKKKAFDYFDGGLEEIFWP